MTTVLTTAPAAADPWLAWAAMAGGQPLLVYAAGLLLAAGLSAGLPRLVQPAGAAWVAATAAAGPQPVRWLLWRLALALGLLLAAGLAVGEVARHIGPDGSVGRWDDAFAAAMAPHRSPELLAAFAVVSHAGDAWTVTAIGMLVAAGLWWARHRLLALAWTVALAGNGSLTRLFKLAWERMRPEHNHGLAVVDSHSFPSGHASAATVTCLWLACLGCWLLPARWRLPVAMLSCGLAWTVAFSRVVLNVHFASDVLAGLLVGAAWAAASGLAARTVLRWRRSGTAAPVGGSLAPPAGGH